MSLFNKIRNIYPNLDMNLVELQDNSDKKGAFIAKWKSQEFIKPTQKQLDNASSDILDVEKLSIIKLKCEALLKDADILYNKAVDRLDSQLVDDVSDYREALRDMHSQRGVYFEMDLENPVYPIKPS